MQSALALFLVFFTSLTTFAQTNHERVHALKTIKRIAFGSCNDQNDKQPLWQVMQKQKPDLFIWGGDNIYADWGKSEAVERAYKIQNAQVHYAKFKSVTPIVGTWDDHDYAYNNADGNVAFKKISQGLHLDFFDEPQDSARRLQDGIYTSYQFGEEGQKIKIIILDNRYFKGLDPKAPMLGEVQWQWLEKEVTSSSADLHFIVTGLSVFGPDLPYSEEWRQTPVEVARMKKIMKSVKAPVFLTGDKHFSAIFKYSGHLEFLSSGMTHTVDPRTWWYIGRKFTKTFFGLSYGQIDISWDKSIPILKMSMRNSDGKEIHPTKVKWGKGSWKFQ